MIESLPRSNSSDPVNKSKNGQKRQRPQIVGTCQLPKVEGSPSISGQAKLINTAGWTWEDLAVQRNAGIVINLPGGGGGRGRGGGGGGRGGGGSSEATAAELQNFMQASQDYNTKRTAGVAKLDLVYEAMRPLFKKEVPAIITTFSSKAFEMSVDGTRHEGKVVFL